MTGASYLQMQLPTGFASSPHGCPSSNLDHVGERAQPWIPGLIGHRRPSKENGRHFICRDY